MCEMSEKIFKCVVCGGNDTPCILAVSTSGGNIRQPIECPFSLCKPEWEEVKE